MIPVQEYQSLPVNIFAIQDFVLLKKAKECCQRKMSHFAETSLLGKISKFFSSCDKMMFYTVYIRIVLQIMKTTKKDFSHACTNFQQTKFTPDIIAIFCKLDN